MYLQVKDFKNGIVSTKSALTALPGSLVNAINCHVTRGAELEKRKAFVDFADLPAGATFGLGASSGTLYVFGSGSTPSNMPANVQYTQCVSAQGSGDAMTAVLYTNNFNGSIYVIAEFASGSIYHYFNGTRVSTWDSIASTVASTQGVASALADLIDKDANFTAVASGNTVTITAKVTDVPFTISAVATGQAYTEVLATGSFQVTNGSSGVGVNYISSVEVNGIEILGTEINWATSNVATAAALAAQINSFGATTVPEYTATSDDNAVVTISAVAGSGATPNGYVVSVSTGGNVTIGSVNNMSGGVSAAAAPSMSSSTTQNASAGTPAVLATGNFTVAAGSSSPGTNVVSSVKVNSVEVLGSSINWTTDNPTTANLIATQITAYGSTTTPQYSATANGSVVTIQAYPGSGTTPNGYAIATTASGVTISNVNNMAGGAVAVSAKAQISTATVGGGFNPADLYTITLAIPSTSYQVVYSLSGASSGMGTTAITLGSKVYSTALSTLQFCQVNDPTQWGTNENGSGFINMTNQASGSEDLTGLGVFLGKLAIFSRHVTQVWIMSADPTQNTQSQILNNIGTNAPKSIVNNGDIDLFFLADCGIRSLRPRDASNITTISDIGTNLDTLLLNDLASLTPTQQSAAVGVMDPIDQRYWLSIGPRIYVLSYYPTPGINAWTVYEPNLATGNISDMVYNSGLIYVRAGDSIYVYGGTDGQTYDSTVVTILTPYMDLGKPGNNKSITQVDIASDGTWAISCSTDPSSEFYTPLGSFTGNTYGPNLGAGAVGIGNHLQVQAISASDGYARLSNVSIYIPGLGDDDQS